jgi:RNA polymerase sigma factor (TIGR02999 family)
LEYLNIAQRQVLSYYVGLSIPLEEWDSSMDNLSNKRKELNEAFEAWRNGELNAEEKLSELIYPWIHDLAKKIFARERKNHTLQPTALVHEAYTELFRSSPQDWENWEHFLHAAAKVMRHILAEHARDRNRDKRPGKHVIVPIDENIPDEKEIDWIDLNEALNKLEKIEEEVFKVVNLRFIWGWTIEETAKIMNIAPATVKRKWEFAQAWLNRELTQ